MGPASVSAIQEHDGKNSLLSSPFRALLMAGGVTGCFRGVYLGANGYGIRGQHLERPGFGGSFVTGPTATCKVRDSSQGREA